MAEEIDLSPAEEAALERAWARVGPLIAPAASFAWDESKHPRGQPENKGEFGPGGGGAAKAPAAEGGWIQRAALKVAEKVFGPTPSYTPHAADDAVATVSDRPRLPVETGPVPAAEHARNLAKVRVLVAGGAVRPDLSAAAKARHTGAARHVLAAVPPRAMRYIADELAAVHYHDTPADLLRELSARWPHFAAGMGREVETPSGMYDSLNGVLQVNGPPPGKDSVWSAAGTLAHELGHALDGYDNRFSDSEGWKAAWGKEVRRGLGLSAYAMYSPAEGFAEFARAVYAGHVGPAELERELPLCSAYWKEHGLWPGS